MMLGPNSAGDNKVRTAAFLQNATDFTTAT